MAGATGISTTVRVTDVAGPSQLSELVSVTKTVVTLAVALLKPNEPFVGFVPVVIKVVKPASLYQLYVLPPTGAVIVGAVMASPTQYELGANVIPGAPGTGLTVNVTAVAVLVQLALDVSVT